MTTRPPKGPPLTRTAHAAFDHRVDRLYHKLCAVFADHDEHPIVPLSAQQGKLRLAERHPMVCTANGRCDDLNTVVVAVITAAFPPAEACLFLPAVHLLDLRFDSPATTMRAALVEALLAAATERLFPDGTNRPVNPTRPMEMV